MNRDAHNDIEPNITHEHRANKVCAISIHIYTYKTKERRERKRVTMLWSSACMCRAFINIIQLCYLCLYEKRTIKNNSHESCEEKKREWKSVLECAEHCSEIVSKRWWLLWVAQVISFHISIKRTKKSFLFFFFSIFSFDSLWLWFSVWF